MLIRKRRDHLIQIHTIHRVPTLRQDIIAQTEVITVEIS